MNADERENAVWGTCISACLLALCSLCCYRYDVDPVAPGHLASAEHATSSVDTNEKSLVFYSGSVGLCTEELAALGKCTKPFSPLSPCIIVEKSSDDPLSCTIAAQAEFEEDHTRFTKTVTDMRAFKLDARREMTCFDFDKDMTHAWKFKRFSFFRGQCQPSASPASPACDPLVSSCTTFEMDQDTCALGWPCMSVEVKKASFTPCTPELAAQNLCSIEGPHFWGCLTYKNAGQTNLTCDVRLDVSFSTGEDKSVVRNEKLYYNQAHQICFSFPQPTEAFQKVKALAIVCQSQGSSQSPSEICDLSQHICKEETSKVLRLLH